MKRKHRFVPAGNEFVFAVTWRNLIVSVQCFILAGVLFQYAHTPELFIFRIPKMPTSNLQYRAVDEAMATFEGYGLPGVPATVNNNPGNIIYNAWSRSHGATARNGDFAVFPTSDVGYQAQDALVDHYADAGYTLEQMITAWAPPTAKGNSQQSTQNYINAVAKKLGVPASTKVSDTSKLTTTGNDDSIIGKTKSWIESLDPSTSSIWTRGGAFLLGLILIGGGLYLFKPVQEVVNTTVKAAGKAAVTAA